MVREKNLTRSYYACFPLKLEGTLASHTAQMLQAGDIPSNIFGTLFYHNGELI